MRWSKIIDVIEENGWEDREVEACFVLCESEGMTQLGDTFPVVDIGECVLSGSVRLVVHPDKQDQMALRPLYGFDENEEEL